MGSIAIRDQDCFTQISQDRWKAIFHEAGQAAVRSHWHEADHTLLVLAGAYQVQVKYADGTIFDGVIRAATHGHVGLPWIDIPKDAIHQADCIEAGAILCIFPAGRSGLASHRPEIG